MKRLLSRILFYTIKYFVGLFVYIDRRLYMSMYTHLLKQFGLRINGEPRFIAKSVKFDDFNLISIGDRLVVSSNVIFLTHDYSYTTGLISQNRKPKTDVGILRPISVGNNVFIGMNSVILPGSNIDDNVIIGAGSVVRGTIKKNSVVSGNPAKYIMDISEYTNRIEDRGYKRTVDTK